MAVRTSAPNNDPGCGLKTKTTERDGEVYLDDSVEIAISPDTSTVYHLIVNSAGVVFDTRNTYEPFVQDIKWNFKKLEVSSIAESGSWELELKIPLSEIGNPKDFVMMNVARNWEEHGASALCPTNCHWDRSRMIRVGWNTRTPYVKVNELGLPDTGTWNLKFSVENPLPDREFEAAALLQTIATSNVDGEVRIVYGPNGEYERTTEKLEKQTVPAGGKTDISLNYNAGKDMYYLTVVLFDPSTGEIIYSRSVSSSMGLKAAPWPASADFDIPKIGSGQIFYYPGFNKAAVKIRFNADAAVEKARVFVVGKDAKKTFAEVRKDKALHCAVLPVDAAPGNYSFGLELKTKNAEAKTFDNIAKITTRNFEWRNNNLGKDKIVIPPFTPLKADGSTVEVLNRKHKVNAAGLWDSLEIKGKEQLAAPMRVECVVDGKTQTWKGVTPSVKVEDNGYAAKGSASITSSDGITLDSELYFEYDGFYWVKMRLSEVKNKKIERLTLVIPLKNEESPLFHAVASDTIRNNPAGSIAAGKGMVWDGTKLKRVEKPGLHPQLIPYIWIGGAEKGLCWFLDSSYGYKLNKEIPAVRLVRNGAELRLEIDIINRLAQIEEGHSFEFGMQSTPVKPLEKSWRRLVYDLVGDGCKGMNTARGLFSSISGYYYPFCKLPYKHDFSLFDNTLAVLQGKTKTSIYEEWEKKNINDIQNIVNKIPADDRKEICDYLKKWKTHAALTFDKKPVASAFYFYTDPRLGFLAEDEVDYFKSEWTIAHSGYSGTYRIFPTPSCLDFLIYSYYQQLKHGVPGIYLDDTFIISMSNTDTFARIDNEGEVHAQLGILGMRELFKRIAVMQHQFNCNPRLLITHMTNALLVPCFSFATGQLSWEAMFGETPMQERYNLDNIRAIDTGLHVGMDPVALGGIVCKTTSLQAWPAEQDRLTRTALAMTLLHGVKFWWRTHPELSWPLVKKIYETLTEFGHWKNDCEFVPYWNNDPALKADTDAVIISSYRRPGSCMVILANMKKEEVKFKLNVDARKLGFAGNFKAFDAETGKAVNSLELCIPAYEFKLIRLEK